jgi:N-acylneuraminate cytidylyltransferase/CMP-N,N'-diacetyllegionaminic acid synthase
LAGRPLIEYTIDAALSAQSITRTIVSTDSPEIADCARRTGAEIPFLRPAELSQDGSLAIDVYVYTIQRLRNEGADVHDVAILLPTVPLRDSTDIDAAIRLFKDKSADSVVSFTEAPCPIQWHHIVDGEGRLHSLAHEGEALLNRQDHPQTYVPNGAIYVFNADFLLARKTYYSNATYAYLMPPDRSVDIDTLTDFNYAEFLMKQHD